MAVALGTTLAMLFLRGTLPRNPVAGLIHGMLGAVGLGLLIIALQGPRRGDAMGVGSFGMIAAVLFGLALAVGPLIRLMVRRPPHVTGAIIAVHASLAITAFVVFLAWASM